MFVPILPLLIAIVLAALRRAARRAAFDAPVTLEVLPRTDPSGHRRAPSR